jgi:hypothetical protein
MAGDQSAEFLPAFISAWERSLPNSGRRSWEGVRDTRQDSREHVRLLSLRASCLRLGAMVAHARPSSVLAEQCDRVGLGDGFDFSLVPIWCAVLHTAWAYRLLERAPTSDCGGLRRLATVSLLCGCSGRRQGACSCNCLASGWLTCFGLEYRVLLRVDLDRRER